MLFPGVKYGCESWIIRTAFFEHQRIDVLNCTVVGDDS